MITAQKASEIVADARLQELRFHMSDVYIAIEYSAKRNRRFLIYRPRSGLVRMISDIREELKNNGFKVKDSKDFAPREGGRYLNIQW